MNRNPQLFFCIVPTFQDHYHHEVAWVSFYFTFRISTVFKMPMKRSKKGLESLNMKTRCYKLSSTLISLDVLPSWDRHNNLYTYSYALCGTSLLNNCSEIISRDDYYFTYYFDSMLEKKIICKSQNI